MVNPLLGTSLIQLIESVSASESQDDASRILLRSLLDIFQMDQAALFEKSDDGFHCLLALDRTGRIVRATGEIFLSTTLLEKSLLAMEPLHIDLAHHHLEVPKSIKDEALKRIVCLPLARTPGTAIFIGSRGVQGISFSQAEIGQFKTAARAAWLAVKQFKTQETLARTRDELKSLREAKCSLLYSSQVMINLIEEVDRIAPFNVSLLLLGESGVGKEEVARHIHNKSGRRGNFVAVNCANLSESLLESELFGYRKGAFTGAVQNKEGLFQAANGGTLFLDEIAEIPVNLQAKLLRALQERQIRPVGSTEDISVDVRIVAATHQDLEKRIASGEFRADLYYRVQEFAVRVPKLCDRPEDIELLAEHFIARASAEMNLPRRQMTPETLSALQIYRWPGNIRELKNVCRTAVILARESLIQPHDLRLAEVQPPRIAERKTESSLPTESAEALRPLRDLTRGFERQLVKKLMGEGLSQGEVAAKLEISVRTLQRILSDLPTESQDSSLD